jgi:hypothetical protein
MAGGGTQRLKKDEVVFYGLWLESCCEYGRAMALYTEYKAYGPAERLQAALECLRGPRELGMLG